MRPCKTHYTRVWRIIALQRRVINKELKYMDAKDKCKHEKTRHEVVGIKKTKLAECFDGKGILKVLRTRGLRCGCVV